MSSATRFVASITNHVSRILSSNDLVPRRHALITQSLRNRYLSNYTRVHDHNTRVRKFSVHSGAQHAGAPLPPQPPSSSLSWRLLGIILTIILPIVGNKYGPLLQFKNNVDTTVETIEEIVEVVEKVAEAVEKVAEVISDDLPEGGKFKKVVDIVENVAEKTAKDAHIVEDAIDKFQEVEEKVENVVGMKAGSIPKT